MATKPKQRHTELHSMERNDINQLAVTYLDKLLQHCTLNLVQRIVGISRTTLYKWLDEDVALDDMNHYHAAWFVLQYETNPKVAMLLQRGPQVTDKRDNRRNAAKGIEV